MMGYACFWKMRARANAKMGDALVWDYDCVVYRSTQGDESNIDGANSEFLLSDACVVQVLLSKDLV